MAGRPGGGMKDIFKGQLVRLSAMDHEEIGRELSRHKRDSELMRLMEGGPNRLYSEKALAKCFEKDLEEPSPASHYFSIRALENDRLLGDIGMDVINNWGSRDAFVGPGIYVRDDWGKGYGTDAMKLMLGFAFTEINLRRVTLTVFDYNPRAIRSYEKVGFQHEGRLRGALNRDGKRWDMLFMGILREDWMKLHP